MNLDYDLIYKMVNEGYVSKRMHDKYPYAIYNYTPKAQYDNVWNEATMICRGLILDDQTGRVVARPFRKFFNYGQVEIPDEHKGKMPVIWDKLDGSLGIIYQTPDRDYAVATRGSFHSDQAIEATRILKEKYPNFEQPEMFTTLVEIIFPENKIVVDYAGQRDLILIGAVRSFDGLEVSMQGIFWWPGPKAEYIGCFHPAMADHDRKNAEGYVLTWYNNGDIFRLKMKHEEYLRLHRIVTGVTPKAILEALAAGDDLSQWTQNVPDEFHSFVKNQIEHWGFRYNQIFNSAIDDYFDFHGTTTNRKDFARLAVQTEYSSVLFALYDGKDFSHLIWKILLEEERRNRKVVGDDH